MRATRLLAGMGVVGLLVSAVAAAAPATKVLAKRSSEFNLATAIVVADDANGTGKALGYRVTTSRARQKVKLTWSWDCNGRQGADGNVSKKTPYTIWKTLPAPADQCGATAMVLRMYGAAGTMTVQILAR